MSMVPNFASHLLISRKKPEIKYDPFPYFCIDDYLPKDLYTALYDEFPSIKFFKKSSRLGRMAFNRRTPEFAELIASSPLWASMTDAVRSDEFLKDAEAFLRPSLVRARGVAGLKKWRNYNVSHRSVPIIERLVDVPCEFSLMPTGAHFYPHTDKPEKLVSFLLYFAEPNWESNYGGATDLYRVKDAKHDRNWSNRPVSFDAVDTVFRSEFRPNRLLAFVKTRNSYHGVSPVTSPDGMLRKSFNFSITVPFENWGDLGKRLVDSYRWRTEAWRFREFAALLGRG